MQLYGRRSLLDGGYQAGYELTGWIKRGWRQLDATVKVVSDCILYIMKENNTDELPATANALPHLMYGNGNGL